MISINEPRSSSLIQGSEKSCEIYALPADFEPNAYSVICGRGSSCFNYVGNRRFRVTISMFLEQYSLANTKLAKSNIVSQVMGLIYSSGGSFVKLQKGQWYQVGTADAREKVGAQFRDCLHEQYRSATKSKLARRKAAQQRNTTNFNDNNIFYSFDSSATSCLSCHYSESGGDHTDNDNDVDDDNISVLAVEEANDWQEETLTVSPDIFEA